MDQRDGRKERTERSASEKEKKSGIESLTDDAVLLRHARLLPRYSDPDQRIIKTPSPTRRDGLAEEVLTVELDDGLRGVLMRVEPNPGETSVGVQPSQDDVMGELTATKQSK
jgi:hypothetical protein